MARHVALLPRHTNNTISTTHTTSNTEQSPFHLTIDTPSVQRSFSNNIIVPILHIISCRNVGCIHPQIHDVDAILIGVSTSAVSATSDSILRNMVPSKSQTAPTPPRRRFCVLANATHSPAASTVPARRCHDDFHRTVITPFFDFVDNKQISPMPDVVRWLAWNPSTLPAFHLIEDHLYPRHLPRARTGSLLNAHGMAVWQQVAPPHPSSSTDNKSDFSNSLAVIRISSSSTHKMPDHFAG